MVKQFKIQKEKVKILRIEKKKEGRVATV